MASAVKYSPPSSPGAELYNGGHVSPHGLGFTPVSRSASLGSTDRPQSPTRLTANAKRNKYLGRLFKFRQMDFEYAFWQMIYLLTSPQKVYRNFSYRKQTKDQWARDDPAFLVLLTFWLSVSSIGFAFMLKLGVIAFFEFFLWVVFVDCIGVGVVIATSLWLLTNRYLIVQPPRGQDVEWGYCFDIHLNAFFPLLMILHFFQLPLLPLINRELFLSCFFGNTLWLIAISYYVYVTFLGYSSLPFLKQTRCLLYPMTFTVVLYVLSLALRWNFTLFLCNFYYYRI